MSDRIIKLPEVKKITGLSGSSVYRMGANGTFPKPIRIGTRSSGWLKSEIDQWLEERIAASRKEVA